MEYGGLTLRSRTQFQYFTILARSVHFSALKCTLQTESRELLSFVF
jgi:hypothetical protein